MKTVQLALALLLAVVFSVASAQVSVNGIENITASTTTSFAPIAAAGTWTSKAIEIGKTQFQGISWNLVPASGTPSLNVIILQANNASDTFAQWPTTVDGAALTTNTTLTTTAGGSSLSLSPSAFVKFQVLNSASQTVTPTLRLYAR